MRERQERQEMQDLITFANVLADIAGNVSQAYYRQDHSPIFKDAASPIVTQADLEAEVKMRRAIELRYPDHSIIGEEHGFKQGTSSLTWVLDPVDGTIAFACGKPQFGNLIALMDGDEYLLGIINQPITMERWVGYRGGSSTLNQQVIHTSDLNDISKARLGATAPERFLKRGGQVLRGMNALGSAVHVTSWGGDCYAYGLLASGFMHLFLDCGINLHDYAPLIPIIEGAGGCISDWEGRPLTRDSGGSACTVLASANPSLHKAALELLHD